MNKKRNHFKILKNNVMQKRGHFTIIFDVEYTRFFLVVVDGKITL